jgi:hypothetical protein
MAAVLYDDLFELGCCSLRPVRAWLLFFTTCSSLAAVLYDELSSLAAVLYDHSLELNAGGVH